MTAAEAGVHFRTSSLKWHVGLIISVSKGVQTMGWEKGELVVVLCAVTLADEKECSIQPSGGLVCNTQCRQNNFMFENMIRLFIFTYFKLIHPTPPSFTALVFIFFSFFSGKLY